MARESYDDRTRGGRPRSRTARALDTATALALAPAWIPLVGGALLSAAYIGAVLATVGVASGAVTAVVSQARRVRQ